MSNTSALSKEINRSTLRLEKNLFEIICLLILAVMLHGLIEGLILYGFSLLIFIESITGSLCLVMFLLSKFWGKFKSLRIPMVIFMNVILVFFWFRLSGIYGPTGIAAPAIGIITIILLPGNVRIGFLIFSALMITSMVFIQTYTDLVRVSLGDYETLPFDYLVVLFSILLVIFYLKVEFDKERTIVLQQNQELEFLNTELEESVSDKEAIIKQLQSTQQKLIESEKMASIGRLTAGLAHELNNPLNFIGGNVAPIIKDVEEVRNSLDPDTLKKNEEQFKEINSLLLNIQEGSRQVNGIIENLLRIDPGSKENTDKEFDLIDLVNRTTKLVKNTYPKIKFDFESIGTISFFGNIVEINQVLLNVLKNSIDALAAHKTPTILIEIIKMLNYFEIRITDNGPGIPQSIRSKIFEPFYTTKKDEKGTGLGLFISYGIINKHGGSIQLDNTNAQGTSMIIRLPLSEKPNQ